MPVHKNSARAFHSLDTSTRHSQVLRALRQGPATARTVMKRCGYTDMNQVRPRITELKKVRRVYEMSDVVCPETNKSVALFAVRERR